MGWHDALASRSAAMGKTAAEFRAGARRKATATGLLLVAAGAVAYFMSWPWALVPAAMAAWTALQTLSATMIANRLESSEARSSDAC